MSLKVQDRQCDSCIYRRDSSLDIRELERQIADPRMAGHFRGSRLCHHAPDRAGVVCRGFWNRHKDHFDAGQIAQRLGIVEFVRVDRFAEKAPRAGRPMTTARPAAVPEVPEPPPASVDHGPRRPGKPRRRPATRRSAAGPAPEPTPGPRRRRGR
jgi:hypothetical protein